MKKEFGTHSLLAAISRSFGDMFRAPLLLASYSQMTIVARRETARKV